VGFCHLWSFTRDCWILHSLWNQSNTSKIATFKYDPFGRRIEKVSPTTTSIFAYDGDNLVETVNASGGEVGSYVQGDNIDEPLAMDRSGTIDYYEQDGLGSVTSLTNAPHLKISLSPSLPAPPPPKLTTIL
jgi:YD repeat-containing protein